ncbi:hypothetical protein BDV10DRAFT_61358 [Aspergillus recurvatus]
MSAQTGRDWRPYGVCASTTPYSSPAKHRAGLAVNSYHMAHSWKLGSGEINLIDFGADFGRDRAIWIDVDYPVNSPQIQSHRRIGVFWDSRTHMQAAETVKSTWHSSQCRRRPSASSESAATWKAGKRKERQVLLAAVGMRSGWLPCWTCSSALRIPETVRLSHLLRTP